MTSEERIQKLEEDQAFTERAIDELGEEVRTLSRRVADVASAIKRLEGMLDKAGDDGPEERATS